MNDLDSNIGQRLFSNKTINLSPPQVVPNPTNHFPEHNALNISQPFPPTYRETILANNYTAMSQPMKNKEVLYSRQPIVEQHHLPYNDTFSYQNFKSVGQPNIDTTASFQPKVPNLPLQVDTTYGSIDGNLGYTHFTLPSPSQSRFFYDEEQQLDELIDRLDSAYPANYSRTRKYFLMLAIKFSTFSVNFKIDFVMK